MPYNNPLPDDPNRKRDSGGLATLVQAERLMQIAILLPSAAFVGWLIGAYLDKKLNQSWIGIAGIIFGGISGLVYVIRLVMSTETGDKNGKGSSSQ
jgi:F0F1-type ATP synthase assembly protein I